MGPLGILRSGTDLAAEDVVNLLDFAAVLSLNLAVFNSLPVPGLDGWTMALIAAQGILRRRISNTFKATASNVALGILGLASLRIFVSDIVDASGSFDIGASDQKLPIAIVSLSLLAGVLVAGPGANAAGTSNGTASGDNRTGL